MKRVKGSCICGGIAFEARGVCFGDWGCSCGNCRKWSGSAFSAGTAVMSKRFRWLRGEALLAPGFEKVPGTGPRRFCSNCGAPMPSVFFDGMVHLPLGALDDEPDMQITAILQTLPGWAGDLHGVPTYPDGLPPAFFTERWRALEQTYLKAVADGDAEVVEDVEAFAAIARSQPDFDVWWRDAEQAFGPEVRKLMQPG